MFKIRDIIFVCTKHNITIVTIVKKNNFISQLTCFGSPLNNFKLVHSPCPPVILVILPLICLWIFPSFCAIILRKVPSRLSFSQHLKQRIRKPTKRFCFDALSLSSINN